MFFQDTGEKKSTNWTRLRDAIEQVQRETVEAAVEAAIAKKAHPGECDCQYCTYLLVGVDAIRSLSAIAGPAPTPLSDTRHTCECKTYAEACESTVINRGLCLTCSTCCPQPDAPTGEPRGDE